MAENSKIEWTDHTFNPWIGCQVASPDGCKNCYAADWAKRYGRDFAQRTRTSEANWTQPLKWNAQAEREGRRFRVFCASLADVFDNQAPDSWRMDLFTLIAATPHLDWLLLTKRIGNVAPYLQRDGLAFDLMGRNVWLGITVVNQGEADRDIPKLLAVPARVRFLSIEPMMGPIDLGLQCENWSEDIVMDPETGAHECCKACDFTGIGNAIDWVICGGESGPQARPMHPDWARSLRDQCHAAGVPFLFKQWGEWTPGENVNRSTGHVQTAFLEGDGWHIYRENLANDWGHIDDQPDLYRVGKKEAGRLLDGRTHDGFPG